MIGYDPEAEKDQYYYDPPQKPVSNADAIRGCFFVTLIGSAMLCAIWSMWS